MKPLKSLSLCGVALVLAIPAATPARENRVVKCKTSAARGAPSTGGPALVANVARSMTPIDLNAVQMTNKALTKKLVVEALFARRTEGDNVELIARFVNCTKRPLAVQARASFMDAQQVPTEPASVWKTVHLSPYATGTYTELSVGRANVANYLVELRDLQ